jgi:hypothetical protein
METVMRRFRGFSMVAALAAIALVVPMTALARDGDGARHLTAKPWIFVGTAAQCGGPAGSRIVTSAWLGGMGLPDNGGLNSPDPSTSNDPHRGLLLNKNGPTTDCSSAGATINGVTNMVITDPTTFTLGYDYRNGGHCGAGAPRFNLTVTAPTGEEWTYFVGCAASVQTPAVQDAEWIQSRSALITGVAYPAGPAPQPALVPPGSKIVALDIVFDEGTENAGPSDPNGVGLAVLDNIDINGQLIRSGSGIEPGGGGRENDDHGSREGRGRND